MCRKILLIVSCGLFLVSCKGAKYATNSKKWTSKSTVERKKTASKRSETLEATSKAVVTPNSIRDYIETHKETAKENMEKYGIPASITLAQGILESGSGQGRLAVQANNHFGIKCHSEWKGKTIYHDDDALQECFRKYNNASDSFRDHSLFLTSRARYSSLFELKKSDYKSWARGLRKAGYATDPNYPNKLINLIEKYELYQYDDEILKKTSKESTISASNNGSQPHEKKDELDIVLHQETQSHEVIKGDTLYSISKKYGITVGQLKALNELSDDVISIGQTLKVSFQNTDQEQETPVVANQEIQLHEVIKGDTLYSISKKHGITVGQLKALNELSVNAISIGQTLKVSFQNTDQEQKTPVVPNQEVQSHEVIKGDTLYSISKKYNIAVEDLKTLNDLSDNSISVGQVLRLR